MADTPDNLSTTDEAEIPLSKVLVDFIGHAKQLYGLVRLGPQEREQISLSRLPFLPPGSHLTVFHLEDGSWLWHHGILTENGENAKITHLHPKGNLSSVSVDDFLCNNVNAKIFLVKHEGVDPRVVAGRANCLLDSPASRELVYNAGRANCEQFVYFCVTGEWETDLGQVEAINNDLATVANEFGAMVRSIVGKFSR